MSYDQATNRLRQAAAWNERDVAYSGKTLMAEDAANQSADLGVIIPVFDANVIALFMDPVDNIHLLDFLGEGAEAGALRLFALITAEFLFLTRERKTSIAGEEGWLWAVTPLCAPGHLDEVEGMIRSIHRSIGVDLRELEGGAEVEAVSRAYETSERHHAIERPTPGKRGQVQRALREARATIGAYVTRSFELSQAPGEDAEQELEELVTKMADQVDALLSGDVLGSAETDAPLRRVMRQLWRLMRSHRLSRDDLILPLTVHPLWTQEVADPPEDLVDFWKDKIRDCRRNLPVHAGRDRDMRDATALVQVLIMNRDALEATKDAEFRQRFVLVTADNAVQEAFTTAFWNGEAQAEFEKAGLHGICRPDHLDDFALRRPLQYLPLMNVKDIPNGFKLGTLFRELVAVLDDYIGTEERRSGLPKPVVDAGRLAQEYGAPEESPAARPDARAILESLQSMWNQAVRASSVICAALGLKPFDADLFRSFEKLGTEDGSREAFTRLHQQIYSEIEAEQLRLVIFELIDIARRSRSHARQDPAAAATRLPRTQMFRFSDLTRTETLDDFIDRLADTRDAAKQISSLRAELQRAKPYRARLLAGSVALLTNHFEIARRHLGQARWALERSSGNEEDAHEIRLLTAMVRRMTMQSEQEFLSILAEVDGLVAAAARTSPFRLARARSEAAALRLMRLLSLIAAPSSDTAAPPDTLLKEAVELLQQVAGPIARIGKADWLEAREQIEEVEFQRDVNLLAASVIASGFFPSFPRRAGPKPPIAHESAARLRGKVDGDTIARFWLAAFDHVDQPTSDARGAFKGVCDEGLERFKRQPQRTRPSLDLVIFRAALGVLG